MAQEKKWAAVAAQLLARLGVATAGAAAVAAGAPAIPVAAITAVTAKAVDLIAARKPHDDKVREIVSRIESHHALGDVRSLREAMLKAAGLMPDMSDREALAAVVDDPQGLKENEILLAAVAKLFEQTGPTADVEEFNRRVIKHKIVNITAYDNAVAAPFEIHDVTGDVKVEFYTGGPSAAPPSAPAAPPKKTGTYHPHHLICPGACKVIKPFVGRTEELRQLEEALGDGRSVITVSGLAGQGKSSLLGRWCEIHERSLRSRAVFWCKPYEAGYTFSRFLVDILGYLTDGVFDPRQEPRIGEQTDLLCRLVRQKPTLIVADGIERWLKGWRDDPDASGEGATKDDRAGIEKSLDLFLEDAAAWTNGAALVMTTRALPSALDDRPVAFVGKKLTGAERELVGLDDSAAVELLKELGVKGGDVELRRAANEYDNHAMAVTILGTLLARLHDGDVTKRPEIDVLRDDRTARLTKLFDKVASHQQANLELLDMAACCIGPAPVEMLADLLKRDQKAVRSQIDGLQGWHLATLEKDSVDLHAIVRRYFLGRQGPETARTTRAAMARWFGGRTLPDLPLTLEDVQPLLRAVDHARAAEDPDLFTAYLFGVPAGKHHATLSSWLRVFGYLTEVVDLLAEARDLCRAVLKRQSDADLRGALATAYNNRGLALAVLGRLDEAVAEDGRAIELYETLVNKKDRRDLREDLVKSYNNRGVALAALGRLDEAALEHGRAIELCETAIAHENDQDLRDVLAMAYNNRGIVLANPGRIALANVGRPDEAVADFARGIDLYELLVAEGNRPDLRNDLARAYNNRGIALAILDRLEEAVADFDRAIELREAVVTGENRQDLVSDLGTSLSTRALARFKLGEPGLAEEDLVRGASLLEEAVKAGRLYLVHIFLVTVRSLWPLLLGLEKPREAAAWIDKAVAAAQRAIDGGHRTPLLEKEAAAFFARLDPHVEALSGAGLDVAAYNRLRRALGLGDGPQAG